MTDESLRAAFVFNPTKLANPEATHRKVMEACAKHGYDEPLWLETSADDPGVGPAKEALAAGVDVVVAFGGDGTVRCVASALVDSGTPMGVVPAGTGNLLCRNIDLPERFDRAVEVALTGRDRKIDVGHLTVTHPPEEEPDDGQDSSDEDGDDGYNHDTHVSPEPPRPWEDEHYFLVMAGAGFDAEVMANAPEKLKKKFGALAYLVTGLQRMQGARFHAHIAIDDQPAFKRRSQAVMVGNVGRLQGGVELLPDAAPDDGSLDMVVLSPKGVIGWLAVGLHILTRHRKGHSKVDYFECKKVSVQLEESVEIEVDGDELGKAISFDVAIREKALIVRVPKNSKN